MRGGDEALWDSLLDRFFELPPSVAVVEDRSRPTADYGIREYSLTFYHWWRPGSLYRCRLITAPQSIVAITEEKRGGLIGLTIDNTNAQPVEDIEFTLTYERSAPEQWKRKEWTAFQTRTYRLGDLVR